MTQSKKTDQREADQVRAFRKAARELGADASDEGFRDVLRTVAKAKPQTHPKETGQKRRRPSP
jgi:hypothetical protein